MIKTLYFLFFVCIFSLGLWACKGKQPDKFKNLSVDKFETLIEDPNVQLMDVRTVAEYSNGHIPGSLNINVQSDTIAADVDSLLDKSRPVAVYCRIGRRSRNAAKLLVEKGFQKVYNLDKGFLAWKELDKAMETI